MFRFIFLAITLLLGACVANPPQIVMTKNAPQAQVSADDAECRMKSESVTSPDPEYQGTLFALAAVKQKQTDVYVNCMKAKGYQETRANK